MISPACCTCCGDTSRCVTARMRWRPAAFIRTPCSRSFAVKSAAGPSASASLKITMLVSTLSGSSDRPGVSRIGVGQHLSLLVVFGQPVDVMLQRVERAGGDDAGLAHAAAEGFAVATGIANQIRRAAERRADRGTETLREADAHRVEVLGPVASEMPLATTALNSRAPSRWRARPFSAAHGRSRRRRRTAARGPRRGCACSPGRPRRVRAA